MALGLVTVVQKIIAVMILSVWFLKYLVTSTVLFKSILKGFIYFYV